MAFSLFSFLSDKGKAAANMPFALEADEDQVYRFTKNGLEKFDGTDWVVTSDQLDMNAVQFVESSKGLIRRYDVMEGYRRDNGVFVIVRKNEELSRDEQL